MIISPRFNESETGLEWEIAEALPNVRANHSGLLQVFLNLAQNSGSVLRGRPEARLRIAAYALAESVVIRFSDNGPGISSAERLFQPFQPGASSTGLGLFACVAIKKGQFIIRYNGRKLTTEQADRLDNRYLFEVNARWTIDVWWLTAFDGRIGKGWSFLVDAEAPDPVVAHREFTVRAT